MENREVFFYSRFLFWGFGISLILNIVGTGFWISELLGAVISFAILYFVKKPYNAAWFKNLSGFTFAFLATIIIANLGGTMYLKETPNWILSLVPLITGFIVSKSSLKPFWKTISLMFIFSLFMFFSSTAILVSNVKMENLLPASYDVRAVLEGTAIFVLTSVTPVLCLNDFKDKKSLLLNHVTSTVTVLVMSFLIVSVLGSQEAMLYRYPEFVLLKRIKIYEFFSNVENLFVIMIVTDFVTTIACGFRNMKLKNVISQIVVFALALAFSTFTCNHTEIMTAFYKFYPALLFFLFGLTLLPKK